MKVWNVDKVNNIYDGKKILIIIKLFLVKC